MLLTRKSLAVKRSALGENPHPCPLSPQRLFDPVYRERGEEEGNADERSRTSTYLRTQEPESCASANFATPAWAEGFYRQRWGGQGGWFYQFMRVTMMRCN